MNSDSTIYGGARDKVLTEAQLTAARRAINGTALATGFIHIREDFNTIMNHCITELTRFDGHDVAHGTVIDYTHITIPASNYESKIKSNEDILNMLHECILTTYQPMMSRIADINVTPNGVLLRQLRTVVSSPNEAKRIINERALLNHLHSTVPNAVAIGDVNLLNDAEYESIRSSFLSTFNVDSYVSSLTKMPITHEQVRDNPVYAIYLPQFDIINDYIRRKCIHNIGRRILSKCTTEFDRFTYAKHFHEVIQELRNPSLTNNDYIVYRSTLHNQNDSRFNNEIYIELHLIQEVNEYLINQLIFKEIGFNDQDSITSHFKTSVPVSRLYTRPATDHNMRLICANNQLRNNMNAEFRAYLSFIECEVYACDIVNLTDLKNVTIIKQPTIVGNLTIQVVDKPILRSSNVQTDTVYTTAHYKVIPPNNERAHLYTTVCDAVENFILTNNCVGFSAIRYCHPAWGAIAYNLNDSLKFTSLLFVVESLLNREATPQSILDYIGKCIGHIHPTLNTAAVNVAVTPFTPARLPAAAPFLVRGGNDIAYMITMMTSSVWFKTLGVLALVVLILVLIYTIVKGHKKESFDEPTMTITDATSNGITSATTVKPLTDINNPHLTTKYTIHDYLTGKVKCNGDHLKDTRKLGMNRVANGRSIVKDNEPVLIDVNEAITKNETESFNLY